MTALNIACAPWSRDGIVSLVALAGRPRWAWASRAVDWCEGQVEALRSQEVRV